MASHNYSTRSRLKRIKASETEDRISQLPDEVIAHILSFLSTTSAVRTSILSSRWRFLWTLRSKFDFKDYRPRLDVDDNYDEALVSFRTFVNRVIHLCSISKSIHKFSLFCFVLNDVTQIDTWVNFAVSRRVSELTLHVSETSSTLEYRNRSPSLLVPKCTLTCNNLVRLQLETRFEIDIPASVGCFPHLKVLHLVGAYPDDTEITTRLFDMSPLLEELILVGEVVHDKQLSLKIFVPTLKRLRIRLWVDYGICEHEIMISTPELQSLYIEDGSVARYLVSCPSSLDKADIDVGDLHRTYEEHEQIIALCRIYLLFVAISKVKTLTVSADTMAILDTPYNALPKFPNLRKMTLNSFERFSWHIVCDFLENSSSLNVLKLDQEPPKDPFGDIAAHETWIPPDSVPCSLSLNLKEIHFLNFEGRKDELEFIKYVLENAKVLELLKIRFCTDYCSSQERNLKRYPEVCICSFYCKEVARKLKRFRKASHPCQIEVYQSYLCF